MTTPPVWLAEFHRRWQAARGKRTTAASRAFGIGWNDLLESAGVTSAEDEQTSLREAEALAKAGKLVLKRHKFRHYLIERISLPLQAEDWLHGIFGSVDASSVKEESLAHLSREASEAHPLWPVEWREFLERISDAFASGKSPRPFAWHRPQQLGFLLQTLRGLSSRDWDGTPVRTASVALGLDSKALERHRRSLETGLARLFGGSTSLESLGLVTSESGILAHGPLELVFGDGAPHETRALGAPYMLSFADLQRATAIRSSAARLLTVENSKTTFRQLAAADPAGGTLIVASSFPTPALKELLAKLPPELEHHHFGDTDPAGWLILKKIREASPRPVQPFRMKWRPCGDSPALTARDRVLLGQLLDSSEMADCRGEIEAMATSGCRGDFEQETLGPPRRQGWPFFE
jgi:hypothetical protein